MIFLRLLSLTMFTLSLNCWAGIFETSDDVFLQGGVCADDPFTIAQSSKPSTESQHKFKFFTFSEECNVIEGETESFGPNLFSCHPGGKTVLSGATYKKLKIQEALIDESNSQVLIYECIKGCTHSPKKIRYLPIFGGDCG